MESLAFSANRIKPPRLQALLVERAALCDRLEAAIGNCKLVLLNSAAGYGKTAALQQLLRRLSGRTAIAWVNASVHDDASQTLSCLIAALDPYDLPWRISPDVLPALLAAQGGERQAARRVNEALAAADTRHGLIVIDDAHRLSDERVFRFGACLLEELPAGWTIAMTTREHPPLLPLARMRIAGELAEFRQADLCFRYEDAVAVRAALQSSVSDEQLRELFQRTQGWPAGIAAGLLAQGEQAGVIRSNRVQRRMFEYLAQEVLEQLPGDLQQFLLRCSVLPELSAARCAAVSGDARAARWLDELERRELFVTVLDTSEFTIRLHELFRDFLRSELERRMPQELPGLLARAAEEEPDVPARVRLLLEAGDPDAAARVMMEHVLPLIQAGAGDQMERLVELFPEELRQHSPELAFIHGLCASHRFGFSTVASRMLAAARGFERKQDCQLALKARGMAAVALVNSDKVSEAQSVLGEAVRVPMDADTELVWEMGAYELSVREGSCKESLLHLQRLVSLVEAVPDSYHWLSTGHVLYLSVGRWGVMPAMRRLAEFIGGPAGDRFPLLRGRTLALQAWLALWQADLMAARSLIAEAESDSRWLGGVDAIDIPAQLLSAIDHHLCGNPDAARKGLLDMAAVARSSPERRGEPLYLNILGAFAGAGGDWATARRMHDLLCGEGMQRKWPHASLSHAALNAEILLHDGQARAAAQRWRSFGPRAIHADRWGLHARVCVGWARAELRAGDASVAWRALEPALSMAASTGEVLGLLMCGPQALEELSSATWPEDAAQDRLAILRQCAERSRALQRGARAHDQAATQEREGPGGASPVSEREVEVLELLARGQSNKLIARELGLSPHTVKRHVSRLLDKISVSTRGQLAAWYATHRSSS